MLLLRTLGEEVQVGDQGPADGSAWASLSIVSCREAAMKSLHEPSAAFLLFGIQMSSLRQCNIDSPVQSSRRAGSTPALANGRKSGGFSPALQPFLTVSLKHVDISEA